MPLDTTTRMLAPFLDRLTDEELDAIPYGIIRLDQAGYVQAYNSAEAQNAGVLHRPIGRHYFLDVCPSANAPEFHDRFAAGVAHEQLDDTFAWTFSCGDLPRRVLVRLYYSVRTRSVWVFVARPDGSPLTRAAGGEVAPIRPTPSHGVDLCTPRVA